jgi:hypothetical protein
LFSKRLVLWRRSSLAHCKTSDLEGAGARRYLGATHIVLSSTNDKCVRRTKVTGRG